MVRYDAVCAGHVLFDFGVFIVMYLNHSSAIVRSIRRIDIIATSTLNNLGCSDPELTAEIVIAARKAGLGRSCFAAAILRHSPSPPP